ncbi:MAG: hypothetical protein ABL869_05605 [Candidatus Nitrotoga sp.]
MFNLLKDLDTDKYKGITPYASEHYGVYQPLLGWESKLTKNWIQRGGVLIDPHVKRILDGRILPGPNKINVNDPLELIARPLEPGSGKSPFKVLLTKDLNSEVLKLALIRIQTFVDNNNGRLPDGDEWTQVININNFLDEQANDMTKVNDIHRNRLSNELRAQIRAGQIAIENERYAPISQEHLELMQYESQIAAFLLFYAEGQPGFDPNELKKLFSVLVAPPLSDIFRPTDPLANIDPNDKSGALSPVGFIHLFRQYFFDLGTFLGEPVEHIWLAPGTTIELIEVSTRKTIIERTQENSEETTTRSEQSTAVKDEISDAVKSENASSTKLGVSTSFTVNYKVYQGTASASLGMESNRKEAREDTHKQNREQTEKLSSEIKRSFKSVFKTVTETTDTRSRRYVLQNTGSDLINYELRRKMRRVGVQLQDLGSQLCWQVFIDDAGATLGLAELVHFAESPDLANLKQPEIPYPATIKKPFSARIPFQGFGNNDDNGPGADYGTVREGSFFDGKYHGNRTNTNIPEAADLAVITGPFSYNFDLPQADYSLSSVNILGPQGNKQAISRPATFTPGSTSFELVMDHVNFGGASEILLDVELVFTPGSQAMTDYKAAKKDAQTKYDAEKQRLLEKSFMESVRQRIKDASNIKARPSWDLREEERTIVYRHLIEKLMLDSWDIAKTNPKDGGSNARLSHVRSEVIRALFDVDAMLYFVAPEWWMPRRHKNQYVGKSDFHLTDKDLVKWDDLEKRDDNYKITEDSAPAKLGSSLGWLLQLDGDNLRNAFLNAPWVKAVIPIRPGREKAALNWLKNIEGHEKDGWDTPYVGEDDAEFLGKTIGQVLEIIADRMEKENGDIKNVLEADKVFEKGFDHLAGGFDAGLSANQVFSQWVSVLPTDQIVAVEYKPTDLLVP